MTGKYLKGFFLLTLVVLACISIASASDVVDDTNSDVIETTTVASEHAETNTVDSIPTSDNTDNPVQTKNIKQNTRGNYTINNEHDFDELFTNSSNIRTLKDDIDNGSNITFEVNISKTNTTYIITKQVNLFGKNHTITLNTTSGSYFGNETGSSFIFDNGAAGSTITNITFNNTQIFVRNTTNVTFDNIEVVVNNQRIGQGVGVFSIRDNSSYVTVENSRFSTTNNSGSSTLVLAAAHHCTIHNNNITGSGNVGNLLYLTTYNIVGMNIDDIELNSYNNITNNKISRPQGESNITYGITLTGHDNNIKNNIVDIYGQGITTQWAYTDPATPQIGNNSERYKGNNYVNNTIYNGATFKATNNSTITYNTLNAVTLVENCTFICNTATNVSVTGKNNYLCNNTIGTLKVGSSATNTSKCECNNITSITGSSNNIVIVYCDDCEYCIDDSDMITNSNKNLKGDNENTFTYNIIDEESFNQYFQFDEESASVWPDAPNLITTANATYIFNIGYLPSKTRVLSFTFSNKAARKSTIKVSGINNLTLNNVMLNSYLMMNRVEYSNMTFNYGESYSESMIKISTPSKYTLAGTLLENITINSKATLKLDDNSVLDKNINPVEIYTTNIRDGIPNVCLNNVTVNMISDTCPINWESAASLPYTIAINDMSTYSNLTITNSVINFNETETYYDNNEYSSMYGVYLKSNTTFVNNTVNVKGSQCVYGVVARGSNNIISNNTINSECTGYYACGINVESSNIANNTLENNYINVTAGYGENANQNPHVAYGALILDYSYKGYQYVPNEYSIENVSYINNTIICDAGQSYGVEIYGGNNLNISNNNITLTSRVPMGIGAIGENVTISGNTIVANGTNNATESTVDYLTSRTVGVYTRFTSVGINITNNTINTTTGRAIFIDHSNNTVSQDNTVNVENYTNTVEINEGTGNIVTENYLVSPELKGDESVFDYNGTNNIIENNLPKIVKEYSLVVDTTEFTPGQTANITASIYYGTESSKEVAGNISKGKVSFKVNGKTLKDANGKVIYAKVVNGTASVEDFTVPESWANKGSTIQAVYSGSSDVAKMSSEKTEITITAEPTITTEDITTTVGGTVTLTATINTDATINTGKVVFKINGKSIKDENGKVIYAKVSNNQVSFDYTLPSNYTEGTYNITAVFLSPNYDRIEDTKTLTVN
ncbi:hypothetical protein [Methanosphaera sp. BMS]|uniref:hypothetical protein n=1 Tax=Methanosphaera sp. BMS TaxID=1789762 RepID=UPI000DC1CA40|nr:hypothetical protein [Methanosphaera sp. BMS]AWX33214.1 hypothetical protein AW729_08995 [Methanosphaera sp. BMS]